MKKIFVNRYMILHLLGFVDNFEKKNSSVNCDLIIHRFKNEVQLMGRRSMANSEV